MGRLNKKDTEERDLNISKGLSKCGYCKEVKEFKFFNLDSKRKSGVTHKCKACESEYYKKGASYSSYPTCSMCREEYNETTVLRRKNSHYCIVCSRSYMRERDKMRRELTRERGDLKTHNKRVKYFVTKVLLNDSELTFSEISELITLFQYTFLSVSPRGNNMSLQMLYMFNKVKDYSDKLTIEKPLIDLRKTKNTNGES